MNVTLMHKETPVLDMVIDDGWGYIWKINAVYNIDHLPVGICVCKRYPFREDLNEWWFGRSIPESRMGIRAALEKLRFSSSHQLLTKSFGLSLSDQYWICPQSTNLSWHDINFFDKPFSEDMGNALFGIVPKNAELNLMSPDITSDGWLKKKWIVSEGRRLLVKSGSGPYQQEPLNELLATAIMQWLDIPHVSYSLTWENDYPYSVCEDFIAPQTELVSAWHIIRTQKKESHISDYQHYLNCCETLGISGMEQSINQMLTVDFIIANEDRHMNNFGAVRNAETLEWQGAAPIFDCGTSMWYNKNISLISPEFYDSSKPFRNSHIKQIELVTSFDFIDFDKLKDIVDICNDIYKQSPFIDNQRLSLLCKGIEGRVEKLQGIILEMTQEYDNGMQML